MILELDVGNSRIKWRCIDRDGGAETDAGIFSDPATLIASELSARQPDMVRLCSVREAAVAEQIACWVTQTWGQTLQQARVTRRCAGVVNRYSDLSRMGVDRWLAMIAAFNRQQGACVVVDAGTALTIDRLDTDGQHLGGYILPGRRLMAASLEQNTQIRLGRQETESPTPGQDTETAVLNGILASQVALLEKAMAEARQNQPDTALFLSGGDASLLARFLPRFDVRVLPSLVLDGLAYSCPFSPSFSPSFSPRERAG